VYSGSGCLPALVEAVWKLKVPDGVLTENVRRYTFKLSKKRTYTVTKRKLANHRWKFLFGDPD